MADEVGISKQELQESITTVMSNLAQQIEDLRVFIGYHNDSADFWYQYTTQRTRDSKLQEIAQVDLKTKAMGEALVERFDASSTMLE